MDGVRKAHKAPGPDRTDGGWGMGDGAGGVGGGGGGDEEDLGPQIGFGRLSGGSWAFMGPLLAGRCVRRGWRHFLHLVNFRLHGSHVAS